MLWYCSGCGDGIANDNPATPLFSHRAEELYRVLFSQNTWKKIIFSEFLKENLLSNVGIFKMYFLRLKKKRRECEQIQGNLRLLNDPPMISQSTN